MIRLRRLAIVLVAIGLVTSAIYATGAFSSLTTSRNANVNVAGDKAGYLGLTPGENGEYTTYQNGKLQLRLDGAIEGEDAPAGQGVNQDAETTIESVFTITNQGTQPVGVWLTDTSDGITFEREGDVSLEGKDNAVQLDPGDRVAVGVGIDTHDIQKETFLSSVTIHANDDVSEQGESVESSIDRDESTRSTDPKEEQIERDSNPTNQTIDKKVAEDNRSILDDPVGFVNKEILGNTSETAPRAVTSTLIFPITVGTYISNTIGEDIKEWVDGLKNGDIDGDGEPIWTDAKQRANEVKNGDFNGDGNSEDEKRRADLLMEMTIGEVYPSPPTTRDPGFATVINVVTTAVDHDINGDGRLLKEDIDDPWECGSLQCEGPEESSGWDGPQLPKAPDGVKRM